ncbi:hypothetical protein GCM10025792_40590 [Pseudonocardia tropica]
MTVRVSRKLAARFEVFRALARAQRGERAKRIGIQDVLEAYLEELVMTKEPDAAVAEIAALMARHEKRRSRPRM